MTFVVSSSPGVASAQRRRAQPARQQPAGETRPERDGAACDGWRGKITYTQLVDEDNRREKGEYGYERHARSVRIEGQVLLAGGRMGAAKVSVNTKEISDSEDRRRGDCGDWTTGPRPKPFVDKYFTQLETTGEATGKVGAGVSVHGNSYVLDVFLPAPLGKTVMRGSHSQKGYCNPSNDNEQETPPVEQPKQFDSIRVYGEGKVDPKEPNVLRGSAHYPDNVTVTWELARASGDCDDGGLAMSDLKLEHHVFPDRLAWEEVAGQTVDGNAVKVTATVTNGSKKPKTGTVTFKETKSGTVLTTRTVNVPGEGEAKVDFEWDTSGYAWSDDGRKASDREIEATVADDSLRQEVSVIPKPVVLVHGLWSNAEAWAPYQGFLNYFNDEWRAFPVGADPEHGKMNTGVIATWAESKSIFENAQELGKQIKFAQAEMNAWHVDLVAHSMGGLISRFYIHSFMPTDSPDGRPYVTHLVMLGTPNMGSPCADLAGGLVDYFGHPVESLRQLRPSVVADFNREVTNRKGVKFSILVGTAIGATCQDETPGDGVVSIPSAMWEVRDRGYIFRVHTELTGREDFVLFVKPRLALGPKKAAAAAALDGRKDEGDFYGRVPEDLLASLDTLPLVRAYVARANAAPKVLESKNVRVRAGEAAEVPVHFAPGAKYGVTFVSSPNLTVSLIDAAGEAVERIEAGSAEAASPFKTFRAGGREGRYVLRFENAGERDEAAFAAVWSSTNTLSLELVEVLRQADGTVKMQAKLTENGAAVKGASVAATLNGEAAKIPFYDDGAHGDGAAGDGVYGATTEKLSAGDYLIEARATTTSGSSASAATVLNVGAK